MQRWLTWQTQAAIHSLGKLTRSPVTSFMTCLVIGVALALPSLLFVVLKHADLMSHQLQQSMQITIYLKKNTSETTAKSLAHELEKKPHISSVRLISPEEGFKELQEQMEFDASATQILGNPLPWAMIVIPTSPFRNPAGLNDLKQELKQLSQVDNLQIDLLWAERITNLIILARRIAETLAVFLGLAVLLIVNNTIRSATDQHQEEIKIIQLIGGTRSFIRRPFLYTGMFYGLVGALIAWILVSLFIVMLQPIIHRLASLYDGGFVLHGMSFFQWVILLVSSMGLGLIGSWMAIAKKLNS